jgi:hypothetical protein
MKANKIYNGLFLFLLVVFSACQSEINEEIHTTTETISKASPLTGLVQRVVMQKTTYDDVIDYSNYCMVKFPYYVTVNNVTIELYTESDYLKVQANIDAHANDNDVVAIHFPVTMLFYNYAEKLVENQSDYNDLLEYWNAKPDLLSKINCLNIQFPITINSYDSANQIANTTSIADEKMFYTFINNLSETKFIAINYPILIVKSNGEQVNVTTNSQFENLIEEALDTCAENSNPTFDFMDILTNSAWKITYFYSEDEKTESYAGYVFVFKNDNTVTATKAGIMLNGIWYTKNENGVRTFKVDFNYDSLEELDEDWELFEFDTTKMRFRETSNYGDIENDYLYFTKVN